MSRSNVYISAVIVLFLAVAGLADFQVNAYTAHDQIQPAVAINNSGEFVVIWRSHVTDGRGGGVFGRCFGADGEPVCDEFQINSSEVDVGDWSPAVAVSDSGTVVVAWVSERNQHSRITARIFDLQGQATSDEWTVNMTTTQTQSSPSIDMNPSGAFVVVWTNWEGGLYIGRTRVAGRVYDADGFPTTDEFLVTDHAQAMGPDVAMDDAGRFVVTWLRMGDLYNRPYGEYVMLRQYEADGTPCGQAKSLTENLRNRWYTPSVAAGTDGQFVVTWAAGPYPFDIHAQSFDSACGTIGPLCMINPVAEGDHGHPCVTTNGAGDYLIVWDSHQSDGGCSVCGQVFTQDCTLPGEEMQFSIQMERLNWYPDAAMSPDGHYVVVWIVKADDMGTGYDIFAETGSI